MLVSPHFSNLKFFLTGQHQFLMFGKHKVINGIIDRWDWDENRWDFSGSGRH
jgi:hypothetical protein